MHDLSLLNAKKTKFLLDCLHETRLVVGAVIEAGVYRGGSLLKIAEVAGQWGKLIVGYDTFNGLPWSESKALYQGRFNDARLVDVEATFKNFDCVQLVPGNFPYSFIRQKISFAHFDMDLGEPTYKALVKVSKYLEVGGIIVLDDYDFILTPGIKKAVESFKETDPAGVFKVSTGGEYQLAIKRLK